MSLFILAFALQAQAANQRLFRDLKLPTQQMVEKQTFTNPEAAGTTDMLSANAGNTSAAAATVTTFLDQPNVARNLVMTPGNTTADVGTCAAVVTGIGARGTSISETFSFTPNQTTAVTGAKAFASVSSVVFPADCEDSPYTATWSLGYGEGLGLKSCIAAPGHILFSTLNSGSGFSKEATAPTMTSDVDEHEKNLADFNGTMDGVNDFELFFFQNYCP